MPRRARSADIPSFDTYPAPTPSESAATPQDWPYEPKTDEFKPGNERLNQVAEQIGSTVGKAVSIARSGFGVIQGGGQGGPGLKEKVTDKVSDLGDQARAKVDDLTTAAGEKLDELKGRAQEQMDDLREQAQQRLDDARRRAMEARDRAQRYARENPLQVILGALIFGAILGIGLRIWRASNE
jgi:ElaB/YqjD/DUF883 family membrane-anchored ribosome-binding protein